MLLADHWYVACPASRLARDAPYPFQIGDEKLVAFRDAEGVPRVLEDRCCHRGVPLSLGRMCSGRLACGYHGWEYDGAGRVVHVPSLGPDATPKGEVRSRPAREVDHYVWVWIAGAHANPSHEPSLIGIDGHGWLQQTAIWETPVMPAVENQLDVAHTPFSHPGIYPGHTSEPGVQPTLRPFDVDCRGLEGAVEAFGPATPEGAPIPDLSALGFWTRFELPFRNYVFLVNEGTYAIYNWVPLGPSRCRLEFMGRQLAPDGRPTLPPGVFFQDGELELLGQDRRLLEAAALRNAAGSPEDRSVETDLPQLWARTLVAAGLEGGREAASRVAGRRRVFRCLA